MKSRSRNKIIQNLANVGLSRPIASLAYTRWGVSALDVLKNDPYAVLFLVPTMRWNEINKIAYQFGIEENSPEHIRGAVRFSLFASTSDGHVFIPHNDLINRVKSYVMIESELLWRETLDQLFHEREIMFEESDSQGQPNVYMHNLHHAEKGIAFHLSRLIKATSRMALQAPSQDDLARVESDLNVELAETQRSAISASLTNKVLIVTGGPGTGKTTIVRGVVDLWKQRGARIKLAAPTGRAAKRLSESTRKMAFTIHRMLEYNPEDGSFARHEGRKLKTDLLIIDESSMIDVEVMSSLLEALPSAAHLMLVGDVDQLPAVGPGLVLQDIIQSDVIETIHLDAIYRQQEGSLISINAKKINEGTMPDLEGEGVEKGQDFFFVPRNGSETLSETIVELVTKRIPSQFGFDPKNDIQVLCPMIKKGVGVELMNQCLQESLNHSEIKFDAPFYSFAPGDKIMQTKNDYEKDVFNGDIGYVVDVDGEKGIAVLDFEGREIVYDLEEMNNTSLAYAVTVHKSQGSEYPAVVIPLDMAHYPMLQRNLLYTAVSRGKQLVMLVGAQRAFETAIRNNSIRKRFTGLKARLQAIKEDD